MDKLYYIVCEEKDSTLFEGRFQGRTRGAAMKFLKEQIGRPSLNGTVFTVTEIPVPLIREIVEAIMKGEQIPTGTSVVTAPQPEPKPERFDAFERHNEFPVESNDLDDGPSPTPEPESGPDWNAIREFYKACKSPKAVAEQFGISINTVKARMRREGWAK
ncbi:MAG: hypothetical protein SNJ52_02035 [Verrucomicrobiia bacterium]